MLIFLVRSIDALLILLYHPMIIFSYILLEFGASKSIDPKYPLLYIAIVLICIYLVGTTDHMFLSPKQQKDTRVINSLLYAMEFSNTT